jgi:Protein of unknown function (DUF1214)
MTDVLERALENFEQAGREARAMIEATPRFAESDEHRAQAYASLLEAKAMAYNLAVAPPGDAPRVHSQTSWHATWFSLGQSCGDFRYGAVVLDGRATYRLRGRLGELKLLLVQVQSHILGHPDVREIGNYDLHEFADADGTFDLQVGGDGADIALQADSEDNFVFIRRILADITDDSGLIDIERVAGPEPPTDADPAAMAARIDAAADLQRFIIRTWCVGLYDMYLKAAGASNAMGLIAGQELADGALGSPSTTYGLGVFDVAPDEALIVVWDPPDSAFWSFQLGDVWSNALDFVNHQTELNLRTTAVDSDGRVRLVIAHRDPGVPNWLDTCGRREGEFVMRNYRATGPATRPQTSKVPLAEVRDRLPASTPSVSAGERDNALAARRQRYRIAFGD